MSTNIHAAKKLGTWGFWVDSSDEANTTLFRLLKYLCDCGVRIDRVNAQGMYVMVLSSRSMIESTNFNRTFLDAMHKNIRMPPKDTNIIVKNMMDLGAEFTKITHLFPPMFAQYVSKYDEFAEGI